MTPEQEQKLDDLHDAIVGNLRLGNKGIVLRLQELEDYKEKDQKFKNKVAGGIAVGTPVLVVVWHQIQKVLGI